MPDRLAAPQPSGDVLMMLGLLMQGQALTFFLLLATIIVSLSCHEFGHAWSAKLYGDDTAQRQGRLTLNPLAHIDPMGLLMIVIVGFGWARPVPTDPRNFTSFWASLVVAAAGPLANLILAFLAVNIFMFGVANGFTIVESQSVQTFFYLFSYINLLLMLFNLIPLGPLDGHYILPYFLPRAASRVYRDLNQRFGAYAVLGLLLLSYAGLPIFTWLRAAAQWLMSALVIL